MSETDDRPLPRTWTRTSLGELLTGIEAGASFKCEERPPTEGEVGIVKVSAVTWGEYDEEESKTVTDPGRIDPRLFVAPGDLLFSRANTINLVGACVIARRVTKRVMLSDKILRLKVRAATDPRWVLYYLRSVHGRRHIERLATGNQESMRNIGQDRIRMIPIPLAPSHETGQIVDEIEQQLTRIEAGVAAFKRIQANLKRQRAAILKAACEGRSEGEALPGGWVQARLADVAEVQLGQQRAPIHAAAEIKRPYIRAANITWQGLDLSDVKEMGFPNEDRYRLRYGDVLLAEASGSPGEVGKPAIWRDEIEKCFYQKTLLRVRPSTAAITSEYLYCVFLRDALCGRFAEMAPGVGILHLTAERMKEWGVAFPSLTEQHRIVREIESQLSVIDEGERTVTANLARAERLRQAVLRQAFEGKLVPQDPNDEPASALLDRRRAEQPQPAPDAPKRRTPRRRAPGVEVE